MTVKQWINKNPKKKFLIFRFSESLNTYIPFTLSYSLAMPLKIDRVEEVIIHNSVNVSENGSTFRKQEKGYNIYLKRKQ